MSELNYLKALQKVAMHGHERGDRTGTGTKSLFGLHMEFDIQNSFPLLTTKKVHLKSIIYELLWFLRGDTNIKYLNENGVSIWDEWADEKGDLGPVYGEMWRSWPTLPNGAPLDQLSNIVEEIKSNPESRRLVVSAWNPDLLPDPKEAPSINASIGKQALPPCHCLFQFYVHDETLSCQLYQRSGDMFLGVPFNIASYALLTYIIAAITGLKPGVFKHVIGDAHIYSNHFDQVEEQLSRASYAAPKMELAPEIHQCNTLNEFCALNIDHTAFKLIDYISNPPIKAPIAI